jgi:hypothetical protein
MSTTTLASSFDAKSRSLSSATRESALNWLALGLLLAAWNSVEDAPAQAQPRPATLRGYDTVSVRALQRTVP